MNKTDVELKAELQDAREELRATLLIAHRLVAKKREEGVDVEDLEAWLTGLNASIGQARIWGKVQS